MAPTPSPDDDPTGVRALLSGLPEPDPMPDYLVERINASLAAAQVQRSTRASDASPTPLVARSRRRPGRVLFAMAGAAAAIVLVAAVGSNLLSDNQPTAASELAPAASAAKAPSGRTASGDVSPNALDKAANSAASTPALIQIRLSGTRYSQADFATQARALLGVVLDPKQSTSAAPVPGAVGTAVGLRDCLQAIGAGGAQTVQADMAYYDGAPALIIVATKDGIPLAYAVGRQCSRSDPAVLRPATPLG